MEKTGCRGGRTAFPAVAFLLLLLLPPPPPRPAGVTAASVPMIGIGPGSNCTRSCGNIGIPYPFGVEPGCYHAAGFNLSCNKQENPPKLFLGDGTVQVLEISVGDATMRINSTRVDLSFDGANTTVNGTWGAGLPQGGNYFVTGESVNKMIVHGCNVQVNLLGGRGDGFISSCSTICPSDEPGSGSRYQDSKVVWTGGDCSSGLGCCQANIPLGYSFYRLHGSSYADNNDSDNTASVYVSDSVYTARNIPRTRGGIGAPPEALPATLGWVINESICPANGTAPECLSANSSCQGSFSGIGIGVLSHGYVCSCTYGYQGNPYLAGGCQDIDECKGDSNPCDGDCQNTVGGYTCRCPSGYKGNAYVPNGCQGTQTRSTVSN